VDPLVGQLIDERYRIGEQLGEGGMGRVYVAQHLKLNKRVAFKVVRAEYAGNRDLAVRFAREAMATSAVDHPNVVSAIDYGTLPDRGAYLVMQYVEGVSLSGLLERHGNIPWARAAEIGAQIADALAAAHGHGIVHRDLKPDNVIIQTQDDGRDLVKILDFGIARLVRSGSMRPSGRSRASGREPEVTQAGMVIGTPGYMAPEQATGGNASFSTDLYALGVVLWEIIVGRHPFEAQDLRQVIRRQLTEELPSVQEATSDFTIPEEIDILLTRLCAVEEQGRPKDAGSVRDLLRRVATRAVANAPPSQTELELLGKGGDAAPSGAGDPTPTRPEPTGRSPLKPPGRAGKHAAAEAQGANAKPWALVALGVVAALVSGALLVLFGQLEVKPQGGLDNTVNTLVHPPDTAAAGGRSAEAVQAPSEPAAAADRGQTEQAQALALAGPDAAAGLDGPTQAKPSDAGPDADSPGGHPSYVEVLRNSSEHAARTAAAGALLALEEAASDAASRAEAEATAEQNPADVKGSNPERAPRTPQFALLLAHLQLAAKCEAARQPLQALIELGGHHVASALEQVALYPEAVCGPNPHADCARCLLEQIQPELPRLRTLGGARAGP